MGRYFEAGLAVVLDGDDREMGRKAASEALSQLKQFEPSLALVFVSAELSITKVSRGVSEVLHDCPTIGTSTAGEICNGPVSHGVVLALLASPHLRVRVGLGNGVSEDYREAVRQALCQAGVQDYFDSGHPFHHMMAISAPGIPGVSSAFMIVFSPGATKSRPSLSHDIHTFLRRYSANRIPIFGGSSADYLEFESNFQITNSVVSSDSIALAFVESEILFGLGLAHGFSPTTKGALVTRASDHIVHELDGRPAAEVISEILGISVVELRKPAFWFSQFPFGSTDAYGNSIIQVPERTLDDDAVQFAPLMNTNQVITLMSCTETEIAQAGLSAYKKAVRQAGLRKPALALVLSCALRKRLMANERQELEPIRDYTSVPLCGFYTYGEKGLSDDGLPVYCNQSVSMLVFSDELNPVAALINKGTAAYEDFSWKMRKKQDQLNAVGKINQVIQASPGRIQLVRRLTDELTELLPWAEVAFYITENDSDMYSLFCTSSTDEDAFPRILSHTDSVPGCVPIGMECAGTSLGLMLLKIRRDSSPEKEDLEFAKTIAQMTASGLYRLQLDGKLDLKLQHLAISNQLGQELAKAVGSPSPSQHMLTHLRQGLNLSIGSLWLVDDGNRVLVKEAFDADPSDQLDARLTANDERIANWQIDNRRALFWNPSGSEEHVDLMLPFPFRFVSIPVEAKGRLRGILNLYSIEQERGWLRPDRAYETMDLLASLSTQIAVFLENLSLQKHSTLYKEVHHRIKNNLHNIAGLLRMQIRRLDRKSAEQALNDSIARIVSIAKVHETLSQGDIGMIDLGDLVRGVSMQSLPDSQATAMVSIDVSCSHILVPSKEATSVALVINELVQNAVKHGLSEAEERKLSIRLTHADGLVTLVVEDNGPGLPDGFDPIRDSNLGLTIVNSLVNEELKGEFLMEGLEGTTAMVSFPLPIGQEMQGG
jgi:two-component sensor histidine kinase